MDTSIKSQNKKIYGPYDHHLAVNVLCTEDLAKQSFGDECNINTIMAKYAKTGIIESGNSTPPSYGEAAAFDFQEAQNTIIIAETMFNALPATVRSQFNNNPHTMLAWLDDPANTSQARSMGLLAAAEEVGEPHPHTSEVAPPEAPLKPA